MLAHFPYPYPDEYLYSVFARFCNRIGEAPKRARKLLFGSENCSIGAEFFFPLAYLENEIPKEARITAKALIERNTVVPFYGAFVSPGTRSAAVEILLYGRQDRRARKGESILRTLIDKPLRQSKLRYCVRCVLDDRIEYGEAYWHRLHQISTVIVCPKHKVLLEEANLETRGLFAQELYCAEDVISSVPAKPMDDCSIQGLDTLVWLSEQVQWLLENPSGSIDRNPKVFNFYRKLLIGADVPLQGEWLNNHVALKVERLLPYETGLRFFDLAGKHRWHVERWCQGVIEGKSRRPERHLLVLLALGLTAEDASQRAHPRREFEDGPWPCLNPYCPLHGKNVIRTFSLKESVGEFACACGFTYERRRPDPWGTFRKKPVTIVNFGQLFAMT